MTCRRSLLPRLGNLIQESAGIFRVDIDRSPVSMLDAGGNQVLNGWIWRNCWYKALFADVALRDLPG